LELIKEEIDEQFPPEPQPIPQPEPQNRSISFIPILTVLGIIGAIILLGILSNQGNGSGTQIVEITVESANTSNSHSEIDINKRLSICIKTLSKSKQSDPL
jgi:hypothetical protein